MASVAAGALTWTRWSACDDGKPGSFAGWPRGGVSEGDDAAPKKQVRLGRGQKWALAADVGGTNTRLMLYAVDPAAPIVERRTAPGALVCEQKFRNIEFGSLLEIIELFLSELEDGSAASPSHPVPAAACLAVAGVVFANSARLTNLDWVVTGSEIAGQLGIGRVEVINDFVAQGFGVLTLGDDEVETLHAAPPVPDAPIVVLGAGTGLGEAYLTMGPQGQYVCYPSEGGHKEWAPRGAGSDMTQIELLRHLKIKFAGWNRISVERVVSGLGICNICAR